MTGTLKGRRVALAEARELDVLAALLERAGAETVRCPLVAILNAPDPAPVEAWIRRALERGFDDVILYTGEGVRRLLGIAERAGIREAFVAALGRIRKITRGPKPVRALREVGLSADLPALSPTTEGIIATLEGEALKGRRVGVQVYGQEPNARLLAFLEARGAAADIVAPYAYASDADDAHVAALIQDMADGRVDAIAFTSSPQVQRLVDVAETARLLHALHEGLRRTKIAAVGPVVADRLTRVGARPDAIAEGPYALKPLVKALERLFAENPEQL